MLETMKPELSKNNAHPPYPYPEKVSLEVKPWEKDWWLPEKGERETFLWLILIHITALAGLILYPLPGWPVFFGGFALAWLGGFGTTICYHRSLTHRGLTLNPIVKHLLIFLAMFNGSGAPISWVASHRLHHAKSDTDEDVSSPRHGGFWWAHLRWLWQIPPTPVSRYCPDIDTSEYRIWTKLQPLILTVAYFLGLLFSPAAFFWCGGIRLVFALHGQCFVNSICHMAKDVKPGEDSSRNIVWLGFYQWFQGENWHKNHHSNPALAQLGYNWKQLDMGWWAILALKRLGLASAVRGKT